MTKPVAVVIGIVAVVSLYLAFKLAKFFFKMLLALAALLALGLAVWGYYAAQHGSF